ncbi:MAG: zinc-ribbon domain-containing protein [Bacteroidota bacterium]|jgi:hypothetical protein|nr:zinc-ribbon domain-containing protein [Ignavibacteria bacterium]MCU7494376.1 zinc-ribbon domain-containing protein [Ignavibacteria bacterium]MCU7498074.1 zinc-ribbon domain-containing protein [Ignavibacteria bacterium]MCU7518499.1 zinc-ribbon domain-containing protein [Ignavibacteria bacterium]MCU7520407.1 zinc-ribbon domain-containing protein [Ignavibacteria bacterium]
MTQCPNCNYPLDKEYNFCPSCGVDLKGFQENNSGKDEIEELKKYIICDVCGEEVPDGSLFCPSCGAKVTGREKTGEKREVKSPLKELSAEPKAKAPVQKPKPQQAPPAKKVQAQKPPQAMPASSGKKMSPVQLWGMIAGLLVVGVLIMWGAGVFSSSESSNGNNGQEQAGNPAMSLENVQRINELEAAVRKDSTNLNTVLELAHLLNDSGMKDRSVPYYQMYLRKNPMNADVQVDLGVVYYEMQQYNVAKTRMRKGLAINPRHQIANFNMGIINLASGSIDSAKIWWNKAVTIDPTTEIGKKAKELLDSHK